MKLKRCPFCGCKEVGAVAIADARAIYVLCLECDMEGPTGVDEADAQTKWNDRVLDGELRELFNALFFDAATAPEFLVRSACRVAQETVEKLVDETETKT